MDCDLVVLGAGGAGLVAAVKASEDSGKKVIILEKAKKPGGASNFAGGPGVGSMGRMGGAPSGAGGGQGGGSQDVTSQFSSWFTSKVGAENFVKTARTPKYIDLPDPSIGPGRGGTFLVDKMVEFCQKQGIQILYETPARKFITDARGKVTSLLGLHLTLVFLANIYALHHQTCFLRHDLNDLAPLANFFAAAADHFYCITFTDLCTHC